MKRINWGMNVAYFPKEKIQPTVRIMQMTTLLRADPVILQKVTWIYVCFSQYGPDVQLLSRCTLISEQTKEMEQLWQSSASIPQPVLWLDKITFYETKIDAMVKQMLQTQKGMTCRESIAFPCWSMWRMSWISIFSLKKKSLNQTSALSI